MAKSYISAVEIFVVCNSTGAPNEGTIKLSAGPPTVPKYPPVTATFLKRISASSTHGRLYERDYILFLSRTVRTVGANVFRIMQVPLKILGFFVAVSLTSI